MLKIIARSPSLKAEALEVAPELERRAQPMDRMKMRVRLAEQALILGIPDRSPAEWDNLLQVYVDALAQVPEEAFEEAFLRWHRGEAYPEDKGRHAFFPKPAEINALAQPARLKLSMAAYRAKLAMEAVADEKPLPTEADKAAVKAMLAEFKGKLAENAPDHARRPAHTPSEVAAHLRVVAAGDVGPAPTYAVEPI